MIWSSLVTAWAGELDGEVAIDVMHTAASDPTFDPPSLSATELGVRIRGEVEQGRFLGGVDYQGREPVGGANPTVAFRLLYRAEVLADLVEGRLQVGIGRFLAPTVVFLPVDGARMIWTPNEKARLELFGGRRGVSTSRQNLGLDTLLPAFGGALALGNERLHTDLRAAVAGDEVVLGTTSGPDREDYTSFSGTVAVWARPSDAWTTGLSATVAQRATYLLAASPVSATVEVAAADLAQGLLWASWDASDDLRVDADFLHQEAALSAAPPAADPPGGAAVLDPTFSDLRLRGRGRLLDAAWIRPDVRLRLRDSAVDGLVRTELRYGAGADVYRLPIEGWFLHGELFLDDVMEQGNHDDTGAVDRLYWVASTGYRRQAVDLETGASFVDRSLAPVSARSLGATASDDLSPFVLQAQNLLFARGFWTNRRFFGGADLEVSVFDSEVRAFVQLGVLAEAGW